MRQAGLTVYDLGPMRGMSTVMANIHEVAAILGHPERGTVFARSLAAAMRGVAAGVPFPARKRGIYLSVYGGRLYGGAAETSYHDVLSAGGLTDAADGYRDWPEYSTEQVLSLDPDVIVTNGGMKPRICLHAGLSRLRACRSPGSVVELDSALLGDPGPSMVDAAGAVHAAVYGSDARFAKGPTKEGPSP